METGWQVTGDRIVCLLPWDYLSVVRHLFRHTCPGTMPTAPVSGWDRSPAGCPLRNVYPGMPRRSIQRRTRQHNPGGQGHPPHPPAIVQRPCPGDLRPSEGFASSTENSWSQGSQRISG